MAEKKKIVQKQNASTYTIRDVLKITDDVFQLYKEKEYNPGAFVHGLVFALEVAQKSYHIPPQQIAEIKRDCHRYVNELAHIKKQEESSSSAPK